MGEMIKRQRDIHPVLVQSLQNKTLQRLTTCWKFSLWILVALISKVKKFILNSDCPSCGLLWPKKEMPSQFVGFFLTTEKMFFLYPNQLIFPTLLWVFYTTFQQRIHTKIKKWGTKTCSLWKRGSNILVFCSSDKLHDTMNAKGFINMYFNCGIKNYFKKKLSKVFIY